jgi:hypothetical protein
VHEYLETFLAEARARSDGDGLPRFVERELREFLTCGQHARGFARAFGRRRARRAPGPAVGAHHAAPYAFSPEARRQVIAGRSTVALEAS